MSDASTNLGLPYIAPSQAQKHVTHNEAIRVLDTLVQLSVVSATETTPPAGVEGERYLVAPGGLSAWAGKDQQVAVFDGGAWAFLAPRAGWRAWVEDVAAMLVFDGTVWQPMLENVVSLGVGMLCAVDTPFSAKLNSALMTALYGAGGGTGDMVLRMNKEAAGDDLGLAMQVDFTTRGLVGMFGSDALRLSVSPDGATFRDGLVVTNATGIVDQPNLPRFAAVTNYDNYVAAETWTKIDINAATYNDQAAFASATSLFTAPTAGTYLFGGTLLFKENTTSSVNMQGRLVVNGLTVVPGSFGENSAPHVDGLTVLNIQAFVPLAQGDTVELQGLMRGNDGYFAADGTAFWGCKIG